MGKVLGIIGGMGPLATVNLFERIVSLTEANKDQDHLHILIDNNSLIPDRTAYILDGNCQDPRPKLIESARRLEEAGADFLIMGCNTAHKFYDDILKNVDIDFLNMVEETAQYIRGKSPNIKRVGLLATNGSTRAKIYDNIFKKFDIDIVVPSEEKQRYVHELIYNIKQDKTQEDLSNFYSAMDEMKGKGIDLFIAGCTEISAAIELYQLQGNFIDPVAILAIRSIEFAGGKLKPLE